MWHWHDWQRHPVPAKGDDITVLFWNVARRPDMAPAAARIREIDADVVALVEAGGAHAERRKFWKEQLPDYDLSTLGGGLLLFIKGTSGKSTPGELDRGSLWRLIPCETKGAQFNCMVVDLKSDPYYSRRKVFQQLLDLTQQLDGEPLLMVGDFNTPIDSLHYRSMREHLREAFEVAGHGYAPTWPYPAPVLTLDQVWVNRHVEVVHCRRLTPVNSDHLPVLTTFRIAPQ
jgi:endonuclease/exonuclease/phosphatase (EEP) superfamily protein YafD